MTTQDVLSHVEPQHQITTDASLLRWGAEHDGVSTGGNWTHVEAQYHINYREILAIYLALQTFAKGWVDTHIRVLCDNTTAVNVVNHMATSHSDSFNSLAKEIWEWCIARDVWVSVALIPGKQNLVADFEGFCCWFWRNLEGIKGKQNSSLIKPHSKMLYQVLIFNVTLTFCFPH